MKKTVNIIIPDAGPLISLAKGGHLDLLLLFKPDVKILIADVVAHEVTRFSDTFHDASVIARFISENSPRVRVERTELGATLIATMQLWDTYRKASPEKKAILESAMGLKPAVSTSNSSESRLEDFFEMLRSEDPSTQNLRELSLSGSVSANLLGGGGEHAASVGAWHSQRSHSVVVCSNEMQ